MGGAFHRTEFTPRKREVKLFDRTPDKTSAQVAPWHRADEVRKFGPKRDVRRINKEVIDESTGDKRAKNIDSPDFPKILIASSSFQQKVPGYSRMLKGKAPKN